MEIQKILDDNEIKSTNNCYLLFSNMKESIKLLNTYKKFVNEYYEAINLFYKQLTELSSHFLKEENFKSKIIDSPLFKLGISIKKAINAKINNLYSIITNDSIFYSLNKSLSNLSDILLESKAKFDKTNIKKSIPPLLRTLFQAYEQIESKVVDNYIREKYNKQLVGINEEKLEKIIGQVRYLEQSFYNLEEGSKNKFLKVLKDMEIKTIKIFNEIKNTIDKIILTSKNKNKDYNNNDYLDILQKEINSIWGIAIENENKVNNKDEEKKEKEFVLKNSKDLDNYEYKIKIINQPNINAEDIEIDLNDKNDIRNKTEAIIFEENILTLTDEDIYDIVSIIYSYDFKLVNKSVYNIDKEKEKIKVKNLLNKLLFFDASKNIKDIITDEEVSELNELLNDKDNLMKFFLLFNNFRAKGKHQLEERVYNIMKNIFNKGQDYLLENKEKDLVNLIIALSQTFYMKKDKEKIYLEKAIKDHDLFKKQEFWENHLNNTINEELNNYEMQQNEIKIKLTKEIYCEKIKEIIITKLIAFINYTKEFEVPKEIILNAINPIIDKYKLEEKSKIFIFSLLEENI